MALWRSLNFQPVGRKLNLASGHDPFQSWVNVDYWEPTADVHHDLFSFPWPFQDDSFHTIVCNHYIEHVPPRLNDLDGLTLTFRELYRILAPGGEVLVTVPYGGSRNDLWNHLHYRSFIPETLGFLWGMKGHEPTTTEVGLSFQLVAKRVRRRVSFLGFDNLYHVPKHLGMNLDRVGRKWEICWVLRKPLQPNVVHPDSTDPE